MIPLNKKRLGLSRFTGAVLLLFCLLILTTPLQAALVDKAMGSLASGRPDEARRLARKVLSDNPGEARALLIMARTESGGRTAQSWAEQTIAAAGNRPPADEAMVFLIEAYAATNAYGMILERAQKFFRIFDRKNKYADAVGWYEALARLKLGRRSAAEADLQWAISKPKSTDWNRRLRLLYADSRPSREAAVPVYKKLLEVHDDFIESQTLLGLIGAYEEQCDIDRAMIYRGILEERYPATGYNYLAQTGPRPEAGLSQADEAERLADIVYAVQLGAFGDKKNAERLRDKYKQRKYTVHFFSRKVADRKYWVVQVGAFTSLEKAKQLQGDLQREDNATYRVVVR